MNSFGKVSQNITDNQQLIRNILEDQVVHHFSEFLQFPGIDESRKRFPQAVNTLELFAFKNWRDYKENQTSFIELSSGMKRKLKKLTLVKLAAQSRVLSYDFLMQESDCSDDAELENLVIDCIYDGLMTGKLDPLNRVVRISSTTTRDVPLGEITGLLDELENCKSRGLLALQDSEENFEAYQDSRLRQHQIRSDLEKKVANLRKEYKASIGIVSAEGGEEEMEGLEGDMETLGKSTVANVNVAGGSTRSAAVIGQSPNRSVKRSRETTQ